MKHMRQDFLKDFVSWDGDIEFCEDIAQQLYEDGKWHDTLDGERR